MSLAISLRQLRVFREVMRYGSLSKAALTLHRSQPALSAMLSGLERDLGIALFERKGNRLNARPEAHYFLEETDRLLQDFDRAVQMMGEVAALKAGQLRVACMPSASLFLVPHLISEFVRNKPQVNVTLLSNISPVVHEWVASQQFDVGIAELPTERAALRLEKVTTHCVCAMRGDDRLARKKVITPEDLDGKPLALLFDEHFTYVATCDVFRRCRARLVRRFELRTFISGFDFVEQGMAYSICDPISAASYKLYRARNSVLVFRPFSPAIDYPFGILRPAHRPSSSLADQFCCELQERIVKVVESALRVRVRHVQAQAA